MMCTIRPACAHDGAAIHRIAEEVRLPERPSAAAGLNGFLIDFDPERYRYFILHDQVLVAECEDRARAEGKAVVGFSIVLGPETIERVGIREKARSITWSEASFRRLAEEPYAYYEQLAVRPSFPGRRIAVYLAFESVRRSLERTGGLVAAVAHEPVANRAPLGLLREAGWRRIGSLAEHWDRFGETGYSIYYLDRATFEEHMKTPLFCRVTQGLGALHLPR